LRSSGSALTSFEVGIQLKWEALNQRAWRLCNSGSVGDFASTRGEVAD